MKKRKLIILILFILFGLPIPLSFISWIGTIIFIADMGMTDRSVFGEYIQGIVAVITMLLAGTYLVTYIFSLVKTLKNKKLSVKSFLPMLHIIVFWIFFVLWIWLEKIYKV